MGFRYTLATPDGELFGEAEYTFQPQAGDEVYVNGSLEHRLPGNLNVSFNFVEGEGLMMAIKDVAVSSGSACTSASLEPSYVLRAMGLSDDLVRSALRFSFSKLTTEGEVEEAAGKIAAAVRRQRSAGENF